MKSPDGHLEQEVMTTVMRCALSAGLFFVLGFTAAAVHRHWGTVNELLYASSLARFEIMAGTRGPVTYLVFNDDYSSLQAYASNDKDVIGVEQALNSNVAKVAFVSAGSPSIERLAEQPYIGAMINRNIPMICH